MKHKLMKKDTYSRMRSNKLVTAVGKGPTIDTAYTSLQITKHRSQLHQLHTSNKSHSQQLKRNSSLCAFGIILQSKLEFQLSNLCCRHLI